MTPVCADKKDIDERFDTVYDDTYSEIKRFTAVRCGDPDDIPDIIQEIYLEYYSVLKKRGCDYIENDRAFIYKIAERRVKKYYTLKQRMRMILPLTAKSGDGEEEYSIELPDPMTVEESYISSEEGAVLRGLIAKQSPEIRKIIYLYYAEELQLAEIAEAMNMNLSTVKTKLYRALKNIGKKFKAKGEK